jgi:transposase
MIGPGQAIAATIVRIYVATAAVDGRKSFDTLCEVIRVALGRDPLSGDLFVFRNRQANRIKVLFWDGNGLVLYAKRLERGTFHFPGAGQASITVTSSELMELLAGRKTEGKKIK